MNKRNTIQRGLVLEAVRELGCHATAEEIYEWIIRLHPSVSKGTVYRNLSSLAEDGEIRRIEIPGAADCYDHVLTPHFHVKCVQCGRVFDVDTEGVPDIAGSIRNPGGFEFLSYDIVFKGICPDCGKKKRENEGGQ